MISDSIANMFSTENVWFEENVFTIPGGLFSFLNSICDLLIVQQGTSGVGQASDFTCTVTEINQSCNQTETFEGQVKTAEALHKDRL